MSLSWNRGEGLSQAVAWVGVGMAVSTSLCKGRLSFGPGFC